MLVMPKDVRDWIERGCPQMPELDGYAESTQWLCRSPVLTNASIRLKAWLEGVTVIVVVSKRPALSSASPYNFQM